MTEMEVDMATRIEGTPDFWKKISRKEFNEICDRDGWLTLAQTQLYWRCAGKPGPMPLAPGRVALSMPDVEAVLRKWMYGPD